MNHLRSYLFSLPLIFALCIALCSCSGKNDLKLTTAEYPATGGAAMTVLLDQTIMEKLTGTGSTEAASYILHTSNDDAYKKLLNGEVSLIFTAELPSSELRSLADDSGEEFEATAVAADALVFYVNSENPIKSLKLDELRGIYSGSITGWRSLGGDKETVIPYQLPEGSFLQNMMKKDIMKNAEMIAAPAENTAVSNDGDPLLYSVFDSPDYETRLLPYSNSAGAVCYGSLFYLSGNKDISLLSVDGISPKAGNIINGKYPYSYSIYAVVLSSSRGDSVENNIISWLLDTDGQEAVKEAGYVPLS